MGFDLKGVPRPHRGQIKVLKQRKRFNVLACGRRWGKTTFMLILIMLAVADNIATGKCQDIAFIGIDKTNFSPIWNTVKVLLKSVTIAKSEQTTTLRIKNGDKHFHIEFWSMKAIITSETIRGRAYRLMLVDEMGVLPNFKAIWQSVLLATLNDFRGEAWFCGTPKGFNDFHEFSTYHEHELLQSTWSFYTARSIENPSFAEEEWLLAKAQLTDEYFRQEYEAEFISLGNNLFNSEDFVKIPKFPKELFWKIQVRYWDVANSKTGDFTTSVRYSVHKDSPIVVLDRPERFRGTWSTEYSSVKRIILSEPNTVHLIETEGLGSMAWIFFQQEMATTYNGYTLYPAGRNYTDKSKWDRANGWAAKAKLRHFHVVTDKGHEEMIKQFARYPHYTHDDYVDAVSGANLATLFLAGGYATGKNPFSDLDDNDVVVPNVYLESVDVSALELLAQKYPEIVTRFNDSF